MFRTCVAEKSIPHHKSFKRRFFIASHTLYNVCAVPWGMFSTVGDIMMHVRDIMSTVGGVQYRGGTNLLLFEYPHRIEHPHGTHDIPHMYYDIPHSIQIMTDSIPTVLNTPMVLMISQRAS